MFFNLIPEELYPVISDYIKILVPSFITYLVTRYRLNRPRQNEIKEKQFTLVYLPLYRLTKQMLTLEKCKENIDTYIQKVDKLFYKNYQFVFPKTLKLFERFKEEMKRDNPNQYHLANLEYQIDSDYEKLKRELGYPSNSFIDFFKRLNVMDKIVYTTTLLLFGLGIYCLVNCILLFLDKDMLNSISALGIGCLTFFVAYVISYPKRH